MAIRPARRLPAHCNVAVTVALDEGLAQGGEGQVQLALDGAVHVQAPCGGVDLGYRAVAAHVEGVGRGDRTLGQRGEPGLGVERLALVHDEIERLPYRSIAQSSRTSRCSAADR